MAERQAGRLPLTVTIALRELRGGVRGFAIFVACLILGVTAIAGVGSLSRAILAGLDAKGAELMAADLEIRTFRGDLTQEEKAFLETLGPLTSVTRARSNVRAVESGRAAVAEVKAVAPGYPFYGDLELYGSAAAERPLQEILAPEDGVFGAVADEALGDRAGIGLGERLTLGGVEVELRAWLGNEPDRSNQGWQLGPTLMVAPAALNGAGLISEGSLVNYYYKLKLPAQAEIDAAKAALNEAFPDRRWTIRDRSRAAQGTRVFISRFGTFLVLVGLTALVVGGAGVSNAVRSYLDSRQETIATLKILGSPGALIFRVYCLQVVMLALIAVVVGLVFGAALPIAFSQTLADKLPVPPQTGVYPGPLIAAGAYGLLIALAFSIWPLGLARDLRPGLLMRVGDQGRRLPRVLYMAAAGAAAALVLLAAIVTSDIPGVAAGFLGGALVALALLRLAGEGIQWAAKRLPRLHNPVWRLAVANLHRPRAATASVVMSLGLGLSLFAMIALVQANITREIDDTVPANAPAYYFLDIQHFERDGFVELVEAVPGVTDVETAPWVRATITHLNGVPAGQAEVEPGSRWLLRGDRQMSYQWAFPEDNRIVAGEWMDPADPTPNQISVEVENGRGLGLRVGDRLDLNILGRPFEVTVSSLREVDWNGFAFNFIFLLDPRLIEGAPHTYLAKIETNSDAATEQAYQTVIANYPAVTAVPIGDIVEKLAGLLQELSLAIYATAAVTIAAGVVVLAGAIAAGHRRRLYDAAVFKIVGATRRTVLSAFVLEYLILGGITGVIALAIGSVAGWVVVSRVMTFPFQLAPLTMAAVVAISLLLTIGFGLGSSWQALGVRPARLLRTA